MSSISVIIPTKNRKHLLGETLRSVQAQTKQPDEIIVVDDHSEDGTLEWLQKEWKGSVIAITNKGKGPGAARNTGFEASSGEYIKFFDSDDLMTNNTLKTQLDLLSKSANAFIYGPYFYARQLENGEWQQTDSSILNYFPFSKKKKLSQWMLRGLFITIPGMLFKRGILEEVGKWREDIIAYEDWDYLFRLSLPEPYPLHTNECAFLYRIHTNQTVNKNFTHFERDQQKLKVLKDIWDKYIDCNSSFSILEKNLFRNQFYQTTKKYRNQRFEDVKAYVKRFDYLVWQWFRIEQKLGRLKTNSNWQPEHGPVENGVVFQNYMGMIQCSFRNSKIS